MSDLTEFDLEKLFLPDWATKPASANRFANHLGEEPRTRRDRDRDRDRRGPRPPRREGPRPPGRGGERGGRFERGGRPDRSFRRGPGRDNRAEVPREEWISLPDVAVAVLPDEKVVESLVRQIRLAGRAFPLFEIAKMVLLKPDRYLLRFSIKKTSEGTPIAPILQCALDETIWFSEDDAVAHVLKRHFGTFYQAEKTPTDPPKGVYTFVAQCGMSGTILGPPNHHDYQNQLRKLHVERFSRMPFDVFKSRVKIVRDEAVVKQWIEDQSFKTEYVVLNVPEPLKLPTREEVEKHFREVHLANIVKPVEVATLSATALQSQPCPIVRRFTRRLVEEQRRFPMAVATSLSQHFAQRGLQFFKVNRTITHVSVARPHYLDLETTVVAEGVKRIVEFINSHSGCTRKQLIEALVPVPYKPVELAPNPPASSESTPEQAQVADDNPSGEAAAPAPAPAVVPAKAPAPEPTPELQALNADLHWLIHQGHVIEFHTGKLETAKKPLPKPPKPAPAAKPTPPPEAASPVAENTSEPVAAEKPQDEPALGEQVQPETEPVAETAPLPTVEDQAETVPVADELSNEAPKSP